MADLTANQRIDGTYALITHSQRMISNLIPNVVIDEAATDTLRITDHPVETGAPISDHAFQLPAEINMRCGFSDSTGGHEGYSADIYSQLRTLQYLREPFGVFTPFRYYPNMLIAFLHKVADETNTHGMYIMVGMRQVILTTTTFIPAPAALGLVPVLPAPAAPLFPFIPSSPVVP